MDARWIGLPASLVGAPHPRFRVFILAHRQDAVPDAVGDGRIPWRRESGSSASASGDNRALAPGHRPRSQRTAWLGEQIRRPRDAVVADRGHLLRWGRYADAIARWEHITGLPVPAPILLSESAGPRTSPEFVEWLMGLPTGWVTGADCGLTTSQQITTLGNGVLPLQASVAVTSMLFDTRRA